jgi:hypothetical protein
MIISITEQNTIPYMALYDFCAVQYGTKFPAIVSLAYEAARAYKCNGTLLILWACVRSQGFTSKEYRENIDIFALGGKYLTYRNSIATGASEFIKYTATDMLQEQEQIEALWTEAWAYYDKIKGDIVTPPPPLQKPTEPPPPAKPSEPVEPSEPSAPSEPWNLKKIAAWVAGIATALGVITPWIPGVYDDIIVKAIKILADLIGSF